MNPKRFGRVAVCGDGGGAKTCFEAACDCALLYHGIQPTDRFVVSGSALNGAKLTEGNNSRSADELIDIWLDVERRGVEALFPTGSFGEKVLWRIICKYSALFATDGLSRIIQMIRPKAIFRPEAPRLCISIQNATKQDTGHTFIHNRDTSIEPEIFLKLMQGAVSPAGVFPSVLIEHGPFRGRYRDGLFFDAMVREYHHELHEADVIFLFLNESRAQFSMFDTSWAGEISDAATAERYRDHRRVWANFILRYPDVHVFDYGFTDEDNPFIKDMWEFAQHDNPRDPQRTKWLVIVSPREPMTTLKVTSFGRNDISCMMTHAHAHMKHILEQVHCAMM